MTTVLEALNAAPKPMSESLWPDSSTLQPFMLYKDGRASATLRNRVPVTGLPGPSTAIDPGALKTAIHEQEEKEAAVREQLQEQITAAKQIVASPPPPRGVPADAWSQRLGHLGQLAETGAALLDDQWHPSYVSEFLRVQMAMREADVFAAAPPELMRGDAWIEQHDKLAFAQELGRSSLSTTTLTCGLPLTLNADQTARVVDPTTLVDEEGRWIGSLRQEGDSPSLQFTRWLAGASPGAPPWLKDWAQSQSSGSWTDQSKLGKLFYASQRSVPEDRYFWLRSLDDRFDSETPALDHGEQAFLYHHFDETVLAALVAQHAFTYESLCRTSLPNTDTKGRTATLIRLEREDVLHERYGGESRLPAIGAEVEILRGSADSFGLVQAYKHPEKKLGDVQEGFYVTKQTVPFQRVFGTFLQSRPGEPAHGLLLGDNENEFLTMAEGTSAVFHGKDETADGAFRPYERSKEDIKAAQALKDEKEAEKTRAAERVAAAQREQLEREQQAAAEKAAWEADAPARQAEADRREREQQEADAVAAELWRAHQQNAPANPFMVAPPARPGMQGSSDSDAEEDDGWSSDEEEEKD